MVPELYRHFLSNNNPPDIDDIQMALFDSLLNNEEQETIYNIPIDPFDPNNLVDSDWQRIGLSKKVINNIDKYKSKGGEFNKPEDLLKIYGFDTILYQKLYNLLVFNKKKTNKENKKNTNIILIELNSADSIALEKLPGIGPVLARRILKFRKLLGGFVDIGQIKEVYGISDEIYIKCKDYMFVDSSGIEKFNPCNSSYNKLLKHPYVGKTLANELKKACAKGKEIDYYELIEKGILTSERYKKLLPYLE